MAYGRLDIYWPDSKFESYMLKEQTVSIGRAEGNTIMLDTHTISRYHFSLMWQDDEQVSITDLDSANGTYVDGVQLQSNTPYPLGDVEEIQAGSLRMIFRKLDNEPTVPLDIFADDETTARIIREEAQYRVALDVLHLDVWPAASSSAEVSIVNMGSEMRRFSVRVSGMPGEWLRINRPEINVSPNETAYALLNIKPPRRPETQPARYQVMIEIVPLDRPEAPATLELSVTVKPYDGFGMAIIPQQDGGDPLYAFLHNQGNHPITLSLSATDPQKALTFQLPTTPIQLQPAQRMRVDIIARAKNPPFTGADQTYPFILQVRSQDAAKFLAATDGQAIIAARFPVWGLVSVAGIAFSIAILALLGLAGVLSPPNPQIENLVVSAERVPQGEELGISWEAQDVETIRISVNQQLIADELSGDTTTYTINTDGYEGEITIGVFGETRNRSTNAEISAEVFLPLQVTRFSSEPQTLVRNVVTSLAIEWSAPGATAVSVSGLSDFTNQRVRNGSEFPPTHTLLESGIPQDTIEILLTALDDAGNEAQGSLVIPVVDPLCTVLDDLALREGPDERFQQVSTAVAGSSVVVLAQDADAGWLRVQLPGDVRGWGAQQAFQCAENFEIANLRVESNIPVLPTQTPTSAPAITPTASAVPGG